MQQTRCAVLLVSSKPGNLPDVFIYLWI